MKATDLMIGDWVEYSSKYKHGIGKIAGIEPREGSIESTTFTVIDDNLMLIGISRVNVKPIPLTPEILEENGFEKNSANYYRIVINKKLAGDGFEMQEISVSEKNLLLIFTSTCDVRINIKHVHELQHALQLCGIEKEIKL